MTTYKKRIIDSIIERRLKYIGALLIEGCKWSGKTTSAKQFSKSFLYMTNSDDEFQNLSLADIQPSLLLQGDTPRLIDEWQVAPTLWDTIRHEVDERDNAGHFILTSSSKPVDTSKIFHSETGRFSFLLMRPMTLYESLESTGEVSLKELFDSPTSISGKSDLNIDKLAFIVCRGGWPFATELDEKAALNQAFNYYNSIIRDDFAKAHGLSRNTELVKKLMSSYARAQATQANYTDIKKDILANFSQSLSEKTIAGYLKALNKIFLIEDLGPWYPALRSKIAVRSSNTRYFVDPSIAVASLNLKPQDLVNDLIMFNQFFKTLCIRDLRVYSDVFRGYVYHYRDKNGLECDAIIEQRNGKYGLIEITIGGGTAIEAAVAKLNKFKNKINTDKMKQPSFLMVLVGVGTYAYRRKDGIYIVPIGCLKD